MLRDLTDREVAKLLGKHKRTVQRWCKGGKLPGAYKAGRSWRIPRRALREAELGRALLGDEVERELRAATLVCEQFREEMEGLKLRSAPLPAYRSSERRNWGRVANELARLEAALAGLPELASRVPRPLGFSEPQSQNPKAVAFSRDSSVPQRGQGP